ncbi:MAG: TRAP transporter substrate-binding protein DctP [Clostridiales bacterium]|nr:TRAP transporter substrate-binding protein DctP [Clostridiales bacterium]
MKKTVSCILVLCMVVAMGLAGCGTSSSNQVTLLMADVQEGDHPTALACDKFADLVYQKTNGRINIEVYHGDTLGTEAEQAVQVSAGGLDFARIATGSLTDYEPILKAFQCLYLYDSEDAMWDALNGSIGDSLLNSEGFAENNIVGLCWFSGGSRNFYNNQHEVHTPSDLEGLTLRVTSDSLFAFLEMNGATGINISYNDIYNSITQGVIDGAENNWPSYISTGHYEVAQYITIDQHQCIPEMIIASKSCMDSLSSSDQEIIKECAKEASEYQIQAMTDYEDEAIATAEAAGCTITYLSDEESAQFHEQGATVNAEVSADLEDAIAFLTGQ